MSHMITNQNWFRIEKWMWFCLTSRGLDGLGSVTRLDLAVSARLDSAYDSIRLSEPEPPFFLRARLIIFIQNRSLSKKACGSETLDSTRKNFTSLARLTWLGLIIITWKCQSSQTPCWQVSSPKPCEHSSTSNQVANKPQNILWHCGWRELCWKLHFKNQQVTSSLFLWITISSRFHVHVPQQIAETVFLYN